MNYVIGERYYFRYKRGWQTQGELIKILPDDKYLMYSKRHGYFTVDEKNLDEHN